jgi:hypothetical protein
MRIGRRTNAPAHGVGGDPRQVQRDVALGGGAHAELGSIGVAVIPSVVVGTGRGRHEEAAGRHRQHRAGTAACAGSTVVGGAAVQAPCNGWASGLIVVRPSCTPPS